VNFWRRPRVCSKRITGPDEAGRAAYLAGLHAAQALIVENTGQSIRRHSGVQREFARLVKDDPRFDRRLRAFLPRAYNLKAIADYATGHEGQVSESSAREAAETAHLFVALIAEVIEGR
jgi:uncharacterized protein (UPF0332 family)